MATDFISENEMVFLFGILVFPSIFKFQTKYFYETEFS